MGKPVPVVITVYKDKKFDFIIKSPPASHYIREQLNFKADQKNLVELLQVQSPETSGEDRSRK